MEGGRDGRLVLVGAEGVGRGFHDKVLGALLAG